MRTYATVYLSLLIGAALLLGAALIVPQAGRPPQTAPADAWLHAAPLPVPPPALVGEHQGGRPPGEGGLDLLVERDLSAGPADISLALPALAPADAPLFEERARPPR